MDDCVLSFRSITKSFGATKALDDVSLDLGSGEIHALVGENGAGKSTLIRILAGDHVPDAGEIWLDGKLASFRHPADAIARGIGFVHQIPVFVPNLSVTENLLLGMPFRKKQSGLIDWKEEHRTAQAQLAAVGLSVDPRIEIERLTSHQRQLVALARALKRHPRVLVLDEITASLSEPEVRILHEQIRRLRDRNVTTVYVSHRLEEIFRLCDRVTVLRDGRLVNTLPVDGLSKEALVGLIVGSSGGKLFEKRIRPAARDAGKPRLEVRDLTDGKLNGISFSVERGEIVGVAGLGGAGRTHLLHLLYGARSFTGGEIRIDGELQNYRNVPGALAAGVGMVTEDRIADGFVAALPVYQNVTLPWIQLFSRCCLLQLRRERETASANATQLGVKMPSAVASMTALSGGNQQKAIFSRWITGPVKLLLLDEPTHGVDIRSKEQIYGIIRGLASNKVSVLVATSELEEFEALCDRVLLLREGRLIGSANGDEISKESILQQLLLRPG
jgi:ABC-type sugar transport system ATPase subunit